MANFQTQALPQDKFLLVAISLLNKALLDATRAEAKALYKEISAGQTVHLTTVQLEDKSTARFQLSLAHDEFRGKFNFSALRNSVSTLVGNISRALQDGKELRVFNALNGGGAMIFGVTAVTVEADTPNVLVLAADAGQANVTTLQLMYLDPAQFVPAGPASGSNEAT